MGWRALPDRERAGTTPRAAVAIASTLVGLIFVWTLVRAKAPVGAECALLVRYLIYAIVLSALYRACDMFRRDAGVPLFPLSGLSAAACTASPYLMLGGIPVLWILCSVTCFKLGYGVAACWGLTGESLNTEAMRQVVSLAKTVLALSIVGLLALTLGFILNGGAA